MKTLTGLSAAILAATLVAPAGAAGAFVQGTSVNTPLSNAGRTLTTILSIRVPAGEWVVNAHAGAVNFGGEDYVRCWLYVDGTPRDGNTTMNGYLASQPAVANLSIADLVKTRAAQVFALECSHDNDVAGEYIDAGASMVISRAPLW